jgi:predicted metal-dependent hydrolase
MKPEELKALVYKLAEPMGVSPKEVQIRDMKRKWASCSSKGRLSFSKDLLNQDTEFIKEVVIHELLHLKIPNHGKLFKLLLKSYKESL